MKLVCNFILEKVANTESGHIGAYCAITGHNAKIGEDYSVFAISIGQAYGCPPPTKVVNVHYADGSHRCLGACSVQDFGTHLTFTHFSVSRKKPIVYRFKRI